MLFSIPAPVLEALLINPVPRIGQRCQSRVQAHSVQVTVQLTVAREPRAKQAEQAGEKAPESPQAPSVPLVLRTFSGMLQLRSPDSARIAAYNDKHVLRQILTINAQTAVLWQAAANPDSPASTKNSRLQELLVPSHKAFLHP